MTTLRVGRFCIACAVALAASLAAEPASAAQLLNLYTGNPTVNTAVKELQNIAALVEERSKGDLRIRVHLGGSLQIQIPDIAQAVSDDIIQIGDDQQFASAVPVAGILRLPGLLRTPEEFDKATQIVQPYVDAQYAKLGVSVLGTYYYPQLVIFSAKKKVASLADLKGLKVRTLSPESSEWVKRVGGSPITLSFPELAPALDRTTIDAVTTTASGAGYALRDLLKYDYRIPIAFSQVYEIISQSALDKLSPASQEVLKRTFQERLPVLSKSIAEDEVTLTQKMREGGTQVADPTPEDAAKSEQMMASYWETWAKDRGPIAVEALAKVRSGLGR